MTTTEVTAEAIWNALIQDGTFLAEIPEGAPREMMREFVEAVPALYADVLEAKATLGEILKGKITFIKYVAAEGRIARLISSYPLSAFEDSADIQKEAAEAAAEAMTEMLPRLEMVASDVPVHSRLEAMLECNGAVAAERDAGTLTVGKVLLLQPSLLLKN